MEIIRIPTLYYEQLEYLSDKDFTYAQRTLYKLCRWDTIVVEKTIKWDIISTTAYINWKWQVYFLGKIKYSLWN